MQGRGEELGGTGGNTIVVTDRNLHGRGKKTETATVEAEKDGLEELRKGGLQQKTP